MSGVLGMPLPDWDLEPCGTLAAYRRHLRRGDPVDEACRQACTRSWHDRVAAGYERPARKPRPAPVHLADDGGVLCGKRGRSITRDADEATCKLCLAVLARRVVKAARKAVGLEALPGHWAPLPVTRSVAGWPRDRKAA